MSMKPEKYAVAAAQQPADREQALANYDRWRSALNDARWAYEDAERSLIAALAGSGDFHALKLNRRAIAHMITTSKGMGY